MRETRAWFHRRTAAVIASWELSASGITAACEAMNRLNRFAKACRYDEWREQEIYRLKRLLIAELYQQVPCTVTAAVHRLACHSCEGTGIWSRWAHYADTCWKCNGTGTYREYQLLLFAFTVGGRRYAWHQPRDFWPQITPEGHDGEYEPSNYRGSDWLNDLDYEVGCETVAQWIDAQGFPLQLHSRSVGSLLIAVRNDLHSLRYRTQSRIRYAVADAHRRITAWRGLEEDDALPF